MRVAHAILRDRKYLGNIQETLAKNLRKTKNENFLDYWRVLDSTLMVLSAEPNSAQSPNTG